MKVSLVILLALFACLGCRTSPPNRVYVLSKSPEISRVGDLGHSVEVSGFRLPGYLNRRELVCRKSDNEISLLGGATWADSLEGMMREVFTGNLRKALGDGVLSRGEGESGVAKLSVVVERMELSGEEFVAEWVVTYRRSDRDVNVKSFSWRRQVKSGELAVMAYNESLGSLATAVAGWLIELK